ncbi:MAG: hypothetical protein JO068_13495 [Hyphomicrobiales bacterium]|nr:hypothetical protein [Hyphomicrobiales bacterium]
MWFVIRAAFCIGLVYSLTPNMDVTRNASVVPEALVQAAAPAVRHVVNGAVSTCSNDPKLCLEAAQLLASAETGAPAPSAKTAAPESQHLVTDTLTAVDRATPWRGPREAHRSTRVRGLSRPAT